MYGNGHHGHNVHYLATAYSFEGKYDEAIEAARHLLTYKENPARAEAAPISPPAPTPRAGSL